MKASKAFNNDCCFLVLFFAKKKQMLYIDELAIPVGSCEYPLTMAVQRFASFPYYNHNYSSNSTTTLTMVGIHGWRDNSATMLPLARELLRYTNNNRTTCFELFSMDCMGCGQSDHKPASTYNSHECIFEMYQMVMHLKLRYVFL